jgi:hypothetical protein
MNSFNDVSQLIRGIPLITDLNLAERVGLCPCIRLSNAKARIVRQDHPSKPENTLRDQRTPHLTILAAVDPNRLIPSSLR